MDLSIRTALRDVAIHPSEKRRVYLGDAYPNVYFTTKESICMNFLLAGVTDSKSIGKKMGVSHRTVDEYIYSMCRKLKVRTRSKLIAIVFGIE